MFADFTEKITLLMIIVWRRIVLIIYKMINIKGKDVEYIGNH